nr:methyltransferase domain-containing protein [Planomicrobium okeanokoites]
MYLIRFKKKSVLDIGCGIGHFLAYMEGQGLQSFGVSIFPRCKLTPRRKP